MDACLHLWDPQAHVFWFGMHYEEMCLTYEEFVALLRSDSERAPMAAPTKSRSFRTFMRMLDLLVEEAREDQANLAHQAISRFVGCHRYRVSKMERGARIANIALAETILEHIGLMGYSMLARSCFK
ncbi:hypothetical protein JCGZ_17129 [Jatropha curcas]|uniref:Uncharacterized protein n=1 Tax=Jatropha curcas TaxID=180498 RepID=A0A067KF24_JATCU|nr:hypothetical protein JCGZ_17129 [Jatropha curcas]